MRALVVSDSHGDRHSLRALVDAAIARGTKLDAVFHCGDGVRDLAVVENLLRAHNPEIRLLAVCGNCDFSADVPYRRVETLGGCRIFQTHGHHYAVKSSLTLLDEAAHAEDCGIALFGHTHEPCMEMRRALLLNPGSASDGRMLLLDVNEGRPRVEMVRL